MAQPARLTPRAERTRAAILAAAETRFGERGFEGTRLEDVAEGVGIRRASIVYYFRDKRELYDAVLSDVFGGLLERTEAALLAPGPLPARIEAAVSAWVDTLAARPALARLLLRESADATPERSRALIPHTQPFELLVRHVIEASRDDPGSRDVDVDPAHLASAIAGASVFYVAALPAWSPDWGFGPLAADRLEHHREQVLRITRRLLRPDGDAPRTVLG